MSFGKFMQHSGLAALAAALVVTALPATAFARPDGDEERSQSNRSSKASAAPARNVERRSEQRAQQIDRRTEQRAQQIDRRSEQRAVRVERQGDRAAQQAANQGNWGQARRIDRNSEQAARQIERRGDRQADQVERRGDRQADRVERRGEQWAGRDQRPGERNRTYTNPDRNRSYAPPSSESPRTYDRRDGDRNWRDGDRRDGDRNWRDGDRRDGQWSGRDGDYRRWDRRWRDNDRYDWRHYRDRNRYVFNVGIYYAPYRNYSYRRLSIGYFLDSLFFGSRYWINDPWYYRLPEVYGPYRWVRYYDDALLVDIYTGEVVDVIYDFFW